MRSMAKRVRMVGEPGEGADTDHRSLFIENGGAFNYESLGVAPHGGLLEGATPECSSAGELVVYQRAQEALLRDALIRARFELASEGYPGTVSLLKNCRDAEGHLYGAQENYSVEVATGWRLFCLRLGLLLLLPLHLVFAAICWLLIAACFIAALAFVPVVVLLMLISIGVPRLADWLERMFNGPVDDPDKSARPTASRIAYEIDRFFSMLAITPWAAVARAFALHDIRAQLTGFVVSRICFTGAGTLGDDDRFLLSEKAQGMRRIMRISAAPDARGIYELPNILKAAGRLVLLRPSAIAQAFRRRQRLQISFSDSNMAEVAEYLKVGTTLLVLDMIEAGALGDAPLPRDPIAALKAFDADPTLRARVPLRDGGDMTALEMQRWYLNRAREYCASSSVVALETHRILELWGQALDALAEDPGTLVGRIDWVTKRLLLEQCVHDGPETRKKIDLRYHEIDDGYFRQLEAEGAATSIVDARAVKRAMQVPPDRSPAAIRGRLIAELANSATTSSVDWDRVRIGGVLRGKVIRLQDYR